MENADIRNFVSDFKIPDKPLFATVFDNLRRPASLAAEKPLLSLEMEDNFVTFVDYTEAFDPLNIRAVV